MVTREEAEGMFHYCQGIRWKLIMVLAIVALPIFGAIFTVLLNIKGNVEYTKGRVDVLVRQEIVEPVPRIAKGLTVAIIESAAPTDRDKEKRDESWTDRP